jgi:(p)ppGpp synthase/HD superfamily hydrolase
MSVLFARALAFADLAHQGQVRKYTNEAYINHPIDVEEILGNIMFPDVPTAVMSAAAILHDVVEDTPYMIEDIRFEFGEHVSDLVFWLTDTTTPADGNRAFRKEVARKRLANAPVEAQLIKVADLCSNAKSIAKHDPDFWKVYRKEADQLLESMDKLPKNVKDIAVKFLDCMDTLYAKKT